MSSFDIVWAGNPTDEPLGWDHRKVFKVAHQSSSMHTARQGCKLVYNLDIPRDYTENMRTYKGNQHVVLSSMAVWNCFGYVPVVPHPFSWAEAYNILQPKLSSVCFRPFGYPLVISHSYWKWPLKFWAFPLNMVIFHSHVKLPEGNSH